MITCVYDEAKMILIYTYKKTVKTQLVDFDYRRGDWYWGRFGKIQQYYSYNALKICESGDEEAIEATTRVSIADICSNETACEILMRKVREPVIIYFDEPASLWAAWMKYLGLPHKTVKVRGNVTEILNAELL